MRVLYLSATGALGGAEKVLLGVMATIRQARPDFQLHLLSLSAGPLADGAARLGVDVHVLPLPPDLESMGDSQLLNANRTAQAALLFQRAMAAGLQASGYLRRFRRHVRRIGADLIHSNGIKTHLLSWFARPGPVPVLWHAHDFFCARPLARRLLRPASRGIAGAIAISTAVRADLQSLRSMPVWVVPNTLDVREYSPGLQDGSFLDRLAGLRPESCLRVGLIATYARWKGQGVFLESVACLKKAAPALPVRFYVVGGPIYQTHGSQWHAAELRQLARALGVDDRVGIIDFQPDVVPVYRSLDVVVHASTAPEPFGLTIIEGMACGKAVIATWAGGVPDIIQPGSDAVAVAPGDAKALADALRALLTDAKLRDTLGRRARDTVCRRFDRDHLGPRVLRIYRQVMRPLTPDESLGAESASPDAGIESDSSCLDQSSFMAPS